MLAFLYLEIGRFFYEKDHLCLLLTAVCKPCEALCIFVVYRKVVGKTDAGSSSRAKREADSDGGEEVVFGKKPRNDTTTNDLK